jgi:hypothetical protein
MLSFIWDSLASAVSNSVSYASLITAFVLSLSLCVAVLLLFVSRRQAYHNNIINMYARIMEHNKAIADDPYRRIAINVFLDLEDDRMRELRQEKEQSPEEWEKLYWGARFIHISHLNIISQGRVVAKRSFRIIRKYMLTDDLYFWFKLAKNLQTELNKDIIQKTCHPDWYKKACLDISERYDTTYNKKFVLLLMKLEQDRARRKYVEG